MNTRLQVEHPVTELVTGVDLVQWQLRIAAGQPLTLEQDQFDWSGHAIECRLYAEDVENDFFPSPGAITALQMPSGPGVRIDSGVYSGWTVPIDYDPLLAKISVWASSRDLAIHRMLRAMGETHVGGIRTNVSFFRDILADSEFRDARLHTGFIDQFFRRRQIPAQGGDRELAAALVAALVASSDGHRTAARESRLSKWLLDGRGQMLR
jgi:acetyl-CoA carboxylase biotin carboxylase subunit